MMNAFTVEEVFSKRIDLGSASYEAKWPMPLVHSDSHSKKEPLSLFIQPRFQSLKDSLNATKSSLNHLNLREWHQHTCNFNSANALMTRIKHQIKPELFTQAWVKMTEILHVFFREESLQNYMRTLHICESPGAFISATNHHFQNIKWSWKAISLNPYYEGNAYPDLNNDDRNARVNLSNWNYGSSNTGSVIDDILGYFESLGDYQGDLITADGSINCLRTPNEQENMVLELKTAEIILALRSLKIGGSFVIKFFTFFEAPTIRLLYVLSLSFKEMSIFKPVTSKEGNSEVYVVMRQYNGSARAHLPEWLDHFLSKKQLTFSIESIPSSFIDWIYDSAMFFSTWQQKVIERNLISYNIKAREPKDFQNMVLREFFNRHPLQRVVQKLKLAKLTDFELKLTRESKINDGDYESRTQTISNDCIKNETLKYSERLHDKMFSNILKPTQKNPLNDIYLHPVYGTPFPVLNNSRFCCLSLIYLYQKTLDKVDLLKNVNVETQVNLGKLDKISIERLSLEDIHPPNKCLQIPISSFLNRESSPSLKKSILDGLIRTLNGLRIGESTALIGFPTFSRFYVGLLFILFHTFEGITFIQPSKEDRTTFILLEALKDSSHIPLLEDIYAMLSEEKDHLSLLSIVSVDFILRDKQFYHSLLYFNYLCMIQQVNMAINLVS